MKIKHSIFALTLALPILTSANTSYASNSLNKYTPCNDSQIERLKSLIPLTTEEFSADKDYQSCLVIDPNKSTFLVAKSKQISVKKDEKGEEESSTYDLKAYLIDGKQQKIVSQKLLANDIPSDAFNFDGIEIDTTPFSTLPNKTVIGIKQKFSHSGFFYFSETDLNLLEIKENQLESRGKIVIEDNNGMGSGKYCPEHGGISSQVKRTLVLSNNVHNGLQDIIVKTQKNNYEFDLKTCKDKNPTWKKQQVIKFDGKQYRFKPDGLEPDGM